MTPATGWVEIRVLAVEMAPAAMIMGRLAMYRHQTVNLLRWTATRPPLLRLIVSIQRSLAFSLGSQDVWLLRLAARRRLAAVGVPKRVTEAVAGAAEVGRGAVPPLPAELPLRVPTVCGPETLALWPMQDFPLQS